jgi:hypothetical protein
VNNHNNENVYSDAHLRILNLAYDRVCTLLGLDPFDASGERIVLSIMMFFDRGEHDFGRLATMVVKREEWLARVRLVIEQELDRCQPDWTRTEPDNRPTAASLSDLALPWNHFSEMRFMREAASSWPAERLRSFFVDFGSRLSSQEISLDTPAMNAASSE